MGAHQMVLGPMVVFPYTATEVVRVSPANTNWLVPNATDPPAAPAYAALAGVMGGCAIYNYLFWLRFGMELFCAGFPRR